MNTLKFIIVVSIALLSTDLVYHQVVNGESLLKDRFEQKKLDARLQQLELGKKFACGIINGNWDNGKCFKTNDNNTIWSLQMKIAYCEDTLHGHYNIETSACELVRIK